MLRDARPQLAARRAGRCARGSARRGPRTGSPDRRRPRARRRGGSRDRGAVRSARRDRRRSASSSALVSYGLTPTKRTSSPTSASTAAKSASSRAHGGHVEYHRLTTVGRPSSVNSSAGAPVAVSSVSAGSWSVGRGGLVGAPGSDVLARRVQHDVVVGVHAAAHGTAPHDRPETADQHRHHHHDEAEPTRRSHTRRLPTPTSAGPRPPRSECLLRGVPAAGTRSAAGTRIRRPNRPRRARR